MQHTSDRNAYVKCWLVRHERKRQNEKLGFLGSVLFIYHENDFRHLHTRAQPATLFLRSRSLLRNSSACTRNNTFTVRAEGYHFRFLLLLRLAIRPQPCATLVFMEIGHAVFFTVAPCIVPNNRVQESWILVMHNSVYFFHWNIVEKLPSKT